MNKRGLGKGLQALIPSMDDATGDPGVREIPVSSIRANPLQPRKEFKEDRLNELAESIKEHGLVQPVLVRPLGGSEYELVAGERRWRASQIAGAEKIPAVIRDLSPQEVMEISLIENLQREDLNPLEEAEAYRQLMGQFGMTQEQVASRVGKSRPHVANSLRLLNLSAEIRESVLNGRLSAGHARALLGIENIEERNRTAAKVVQSGLSVRQTELMVQRRGLGRRVPLKRVERSETEVLATEEKLRCRLSTKVSIKAGKRGGKIEIEYYSPEELNRIVEIIEGAHI